MQEISNAIQAVVKELFDIETHVVLTRPDEQFGDYATNVAFQLASKLASPPAGGPRELAEAIAVKTRENSSQMIADISVAGPGFLNITLSDETLISGLSYDLHMARQYDAVLLEYSCPNAFKELHTGHLYQTIVGDAMGRVLEATGTKVFRANFGGDVGLHVAKCMHGIVQEFGGEYPEKLADIPTEERAQWISKMYVLGATAYEENEAAKEVITRINSQIYAFHADNDHDSPLAQIYWTCRDWSYEYFKDFYEKIRVEPFDKYYPESTTIDPGLALVRQHTGSVFTESEGAVVFEGEQAGLHTRVFVTSKGLPTYETKDLGVIITEAADFSYDRRVIITGNDQSEYMKVVFAALQAINPELAAKQTHFTNGTIRFGSGQKMSSRLGNVTRAVDVIQEIDEVISGENPGTDHYSTALAAIKYSFLKHRLGGDIAFDIHESVSLEGNSGPYLQYAHARARSILAKSTADASTITELEAGERSLVRKLNEYQEVVTKSAHDFMPHYISGYLYELAQAFNRFYENNRVIGDPRESQRLALVKSYADTLKNGLGLLGIEAPDHM
jgi:arginyl-tRNA synthetase